MTDAVIFYRVDQVGRAKQEKTKTRRGRRL